MVVTVTIHTSMGYLWQGPSRAGILKKNSFLGQAKAYGDGGDVSCTENINTA